jgi:AcrR family transcriptional regulator
VPAPASRNATEAKFLDAAERLLVRVGHAAITTRLVADEAGANAGLVHYYFGSMDNLFLRVLERFTDRLIDRQRAMYADPDVPFLDKWRTAMRYLDADRDYQKVWYELQALAWSRPELRARVAWVDSQWRAVLLEAFEEPRRRYGIEMSLEALVSLVITFNEGIMLERLSGITRGQQALLDWIDGWLTNREAKTAARERKLES